MPDIDNLKKQAKRLVKQHRDRYWPVAQKLRLSLPRCAGLTDRDILDAPFTLAEAQAIVARDAGFADWADALRALARAAPGHVAPPPAADAPPRLCIAYPQLFVGDVRRSAAFYCDRLGFAIEYLYGEPPFYALVAREGVGLNLRHVDAPPVDAALRERESLLAASFVVERVKALFLEYRAQEVEFAQTLKAQPWGASDFIVRDPDGNLLSFASPVSDNDRRWSDPPS